MSAVRSVYSNLPGVAEGWITVISWDESNPKAGKHALLDTMVGMAVPVLDVMDGGSRVYAPASQPFRRAILRDLRCRA